MVTITPNILDNEANDYPYDFSPRYREQSKRISQMIAFVWRYLGDDKDTEKAETATELDRYFKNTEYKLKDLLFAEKDSEPFMLMARVFETSPLKEPLFSKKEAEIFEITVDIEQFRTELIDPEIGETRYKAVMAYPPRPLISDNGQLTNEELEKWIKADSERVVSGEVTAPNPFIPLCCS